MPSPSDRTSAVHTVSQAEWAVAGLFTLTAGYFHLRFALGAGGLWRDEANTVGIASLPNFGEVWRHLGFDSFPLLWMLVVRGLCLLGLGTDPVLRGVGCAVGLGGVAVLWWLAREFYGRPPLLSLVLFALCPNTILWSDTARAHGIGVLTGLTAFGFIWRAVKDPTRGRLLAATIASIVAAQTSYYNCIVIFAAIAGGLAVTISRRELRAGAALVATGVPAALSLLPYLDVFRRAHDWNMLVQIPAYTPGTFWTLLSRTLALTGDLTIWAWASLVILLLAVAVVFGRGDPVFHFNATTLVVGILAYYFFLHALSYPTQVWYYVVLLGLIAATLDAIQGAAVAGLARPLPTRILRLACCLTGFGFAGYGLAEIIPLRLTNIDLVAQAVAREAGPHDLVILNPWHLGISYARYAPANVPWNTLPPLPFHAFHRYDLIKEMMEQPDGSAPIQPLLDQARRTLSLGGSLYFVGNITVPKPGEPATVLPAAPGTIHGWSTEAYQASWTEQFGAFLRDHAVHASDVPIEPADLPVNPFEDAPVVRVSGWRD